MKKRTIRPNIAKPLPCTTTISAIAKELEIKLCNKSKEGKPFKTSRTIEGNFVKLADYPETNKEEFKNSLGHYEVPKEVAPLVEAILNEALVKNGFFDKFLKDKEQEVEVEDLLNTFNNVNDYLIEQKMEKDKRLFLLNILDESLQYSFFANYYNIQETLKSILIMIEPLPYVHKLAYINEIYKDVFQKWQTIIKNEVEELNSHKQELEELLREIETPDECLDD